MSSQARTNEITDRAIKASDNPTIGCVKQGLFALPEAEPADYISEAIGLARFEYLSGRKYQGVNLIRRS